MITLHMLLIFCPLMFLAGLIDSIGGGGGLIALPACMLAGLPIHQAVGTNKISSVFGTTLTTARFFKGNLINLKIGIPTIVFAIIGSSIGASLSIMTDAAILEKILLPVLVVAAVIVFNKKLFKDHGEEIEFTLSTCIRACIVALVVGVYDGFYGPGGGTFMIIGLTMLAKMSMRQAGGQAKLINLATCVSGVIVYVMNGKALWTLGLLGAVFNMAGSYIGSGLAIHKGEKIIRPIIIVVLLILAIKILLGQ